MTSSPNSRPCRMSNLSPSTLTRSEQEAILLATAAPPRNHAIYSIARDQAVIEVPALVVVKGSLPPRALGLVMEWASQHRDEWVADWELARAKAPLKAITPLE